MWKNGQNKNTKINKKSKESQTGNSSFAMKQLNGFTSLETLFMNV